MKIDGYHWDGRNGVLVRVPEYDISPESREDTHGAGCECADCMWVEEKYFRTYTPSVPEDAPEGDE